MEACVASKLFYKLAPNDYLKGVRGLKPDELGIYTIVVMLVYASEGYLLDDPAKIAQRCRTNKRTVERCLDALVAAGRLER